VTKSGYPWSVVTEELHTDHKPTWRDLINHATRHGVSTSYRDPRHQLRCWLVPKRMEKNIEIMNAALGIYWSFRDIGISELPNLRELFDSLLDNWLIPGVEHTLLVYVSTPEYDFFDDPMYHQKASTTMASAKPSLTVSQIEEIAALLCRTLLNAHQKFLQHPHLQRWISPGHHSIQLPGDIKKLFADVAILGVGREFGVQAEALRRSQSYDSPLQVCIAYGDCSSCHNVTIVLTAHTTLLDILSMKDGLFCVDYITRECDLEGSRVWLLPTDQPDACKLSFLVIRGRNARI